MDSLLALFELPRISFLLGFFFLWAGWFRSRRLPPTSLTAAGGKYVFALVGVLLLCNGAYLMWQH
jgi:hypothetical protein